MGITAIVTDRKYFSVTRNGPTFALNTGDYTTNLIGCPLEKMKLVQTIRVSWDSGAINGDQFYFIAAGQCQRSTGNFITDGWAVGDSFNYLDSFNGATFFAGTITALSSDGLNMYYTVNSGSDQTGNTQTDTYFRGTTVLKALQYRFGIIENNEATNYLHKATGYEQGYTFKDLTVSDDGIPLNDINVWEAGSITCSTGVISGTYYQTFTITHYFTQPFYAPGYEQNIEDETIPTEYAGSNSLKYVCNYDFRAVYSNPNVAKVGTDDKNLGSTAWFNENFNGLIPAYSYASVGYEDTATSTVVTNIQKAYKTRVTVIINGAFTSGLQTFGIYIAKAPATVANLQDTFNELFIQDSVQGPTDAAAVSGSGIITNYSAVTDAGGTFCTVTFDVEYNTDQKLRIASGDFYLIGVLMATTSISNAASDRVNVLVDYDEFVVSDDVPGLLEWRDNRYYSHLQVYPDVSVGLTKSEHDYKGWIEDGILNNFNFDLDGAQNVRLNGLKVELVVYNNVTHAYWVISSYTFNTAAGAEGSLGAYIFSQYNIQSKRDFNLPTGDQFNLVKLQTASTLRNTSWLNYNCVVGWKIDWQKWIQNSNVDNSFIDLSQLFNGFNQHTSNFISGNWQIKFLYTATIASGLTPDLTNYEFLSPRIIVMDYTRDGNTPPKWVGVLTTWDETGTTNLGGKVLSNGKTLFKTVWTWNTAVYGVMTDVNEDFVGIHRIEPHYIPASNAIEEFSSLRFNKNEKLIAVSGSTLLKVVLGVSTVTTTCLIDNTKLNPGTNYKLSSRLFATNALVGLTWEDINVQWEFIDTTWQYL